MQKCSLTCFGVGDGWPCADRNHASFLYRFGTTSFLVDCGEPVDRCLKASGLSYDSIDAIFLSHMHSDHMAGLFMLTQGLWLERRKRDLPVHLPGNAIKPLREMFNTALLFDELLQFRRKFVALKPGRHSLVNNVRVTPFPTSHLDGLRTRFGKKYPGRFSAFCFLIEAGKLRIGHSADLGHTTDLEPLLKKPLDLLVCELSHFEPVRMFDYLRGRKIGKAVFMHLSEAQWRNLPKLRQLAARALPDVPHHFASDGEEFTL
ncbi:MAG TPA: MBL fold metallo-hydrolase [Candidatus Paceibacterota bacterium]|nr:MBL fold metallo-hydrolase [Candidatus Paceibacterota bacterium]